MKREHKYKFWLGHTRKMTYAHSLQEISKVIPEFTPDIIPLEYTGIKDKNKVEIYEGDIIRVIKEGVLQFRKVFWTEDMAGFFTENIHFKEDTLFGFSWLNSAYSIEVIGNVFEHSELLNSKPL